MALSGLEQRYQPLGNTFLEPAPVQKLGGTPRRRSRSYSGYPRFQEVANELTASNPSPQSQDKKIDDAQEMQDTAEKGNTQFSEGSAVGEDVGPCEEANATTIMIRNLPNISQIALLKELDESGFKDTYDFAYMPCHFNTGLGKGYAFVNFLTPQLATAMTCSWDHSHRLGMANFQTPLSVAMASLQGFTANVQKWNNPRMRRIRNTALRPFIGALKSPEKPARQCGNRDVHEIEQERMNALFEAMDWRRPQYARTGDDRNMHIMEDRGNQITSMRAIEEPTHFHSMNAGPLPTLLGRQPMNLYKAVSTTAHQMSFQDQAGTNRIPSAPIPHACVPSYSTYHRSGLESVQCPPSRNVNVQCIPPPPPAAPPACCWSQCEAAGCQPPTSEPYIPKKCNALVAPMWPTIEQMPLTFANQPTPKGLPLQCVESFQTVLDDDQDEQDLW